MSEGPCTVRSKFDKLERVRRSLYRLNQFEHVKGAKASTRSQSGTWVLFTNPNFGQTNMTEDITSATQLAHTAPKRRQWNVEPKKL